MTDKVCPKCKKSGQFNYFDEPDHTGVTGIFRHKTGKMVEVKNLMGGTRLVEEEVKCFVTQEDLDKCEWFKSWFEELKKVREKYWAEQDNINQIEYERMTMESYTKGGE